MSKAPKTAPSESVLRLAEAFQGVITDAVEPLREDIRELKGGLTAMEGRFREHRKEMSAEMEKHSKAVSSQMDKHHEEIKKLLTGGARAGSATSSGGSLSLAAKGKG